MTALYRLPYNLRRLQLSLCLQRRLHHSTHKTGNIDDQTDSSVAKNRRARDAGHPTKRPAEWLHYRLHATEQFVDCDSGMALIQADNNDVFLLRSLTGQAKQAPQTHVGKRGSTQTKNPAG